MLGFATRTITTASSLMRSIVPIDPAASAPPSTILLAHGAVFAALAVIADDPPRAIRHRRSLRAGSQQSQR
jgi:hypothetical protein